MDSCHDRLNACDAPEDSKDRQNGDIIVQARPPEEHKAIRQAHPEKTRYFTYDGGHLRKYLRPFKL